MPEQIDIPEHYRPTFKKNVSHELQQPISKLRDKVEFASCEGDAASLLEVVGQRTARIHDGMGTKGEDTPNIASEHDRRWGYPRLVDDGELFEKADKLQSLIDPQGVTVKSFAMSFARAIDHGLIIPAFFSKAKKGRKGETSVIFTAANTIGKDVGGANTGLNTKKLIAAQTMLMLNKVDLEVEQPFIILPAAQHGDLLGDIQVTSKEFTSKPVLENGKIKHFMGFEFVWLELPAAKSNIRELPVWTKPGMCLAQWEDLTVNLGPNPQKRFMPHLYMSQFMDATRLDEKRVGKIQCYEA